jgi:uncharacterized protein YoxC
LLAKIRQQAADSKNLSQKPSTTIPIAPKQLVPKSKLLLPGHQEIPTPGASQPIPQAESPLNPSGQPLTQLARLIEINRRLSEPDRARFSDALYDFEVSIDQANGVWAKANRVDVDLKSNDIEYRKTRLHEVISTAKDYEQAFRSVRQKRHYFDEQIAYIFGDNADNNASIVSNAASAYLYILNTIEHVQSKDDKPILDLILDQHNRYQPAITNFEIWRQECVRRLQQMRDSIK